MRDSISIFPCPTIRYSLTAEEAVALIRDNRESNPDQLARLLTYAEAAGGNLELIDRLWVELDVAFSGLGERKGKDEKGS